MQESPGPAIFDRLYPEVVNWIVETAEWTQDSTCYTFTSCSCGVPSAAASGQPVPRHKRSADFLSQKPSNRILHGTDVPDSKYPWEVIIFNRLKHSGGQCPSDEPQFFKGKNPDGVDYDICSGSLISNKHLLTSADCILKNRAEMEAQHTNREKVVPQYSAASCLFAILGQTNRVAAVNHEQIQTIIKRYPHEQAFTNVNQFNYNLGNYPSLKA